MTGSSQIYRPIKRSRESQFLAMLELLVVAITLGLLASIILPNGAGFVDSKALYFIRMIWRVP